MKIVHLTSAHPACDTRIFHKECRSLAQAGFDVVLVADHNRDEVAHGVTIKALTKPHRRLERMTKGVWRVYQQALRQDGDIYHFHDPELIPVGLLLRRRGKKVIYDIHEDLPRQIHSKFYLPAWIRGPLAKVVERVENAASRKFSALAPATPVIAQRFRALNPNTVVIHNYPILARRTERGVPWSERPFTIVYAGLITRERGILELVTALGLLPPQSPVRLVLAGRILPQSLLQEVSQLPGWGRVKYAGFVDPERIAELLAGARIGMVVLRPQINYIDSLPIKLFEYMSAGIPVIASDFPLWRQIVETSQCGLLVDPMDPQQIAAAVEHLMSHPEVCEAMGQRGRAAVESQYNWDCEQRKLLGLYRRLSGSKAPVEIQERLDNSRSAASF